MPAPILVDVDWLEHRLGNDDLRVFDTTTMLKPDPERVYRVEADKAGYLEAHIPGAGFLDLQQDFSNNDLSLRFTLPAAEAFAAAAGRHGISNDSHVVLYTTTNPMWATRFWWMFRTFGHESVSVLDGGFKGWQAAGKPVSDGEQQYPPANFGARFDARRVADRHRVLAATESGACVLNALSHEQFVGEGTHYGRPGRIAGSENLPWSELLDGDGRFLPVDQLRKKFETTRALEADEVITYCGGGIAASLDLFVLALLGEEDKVALYDNSLSEWARDESLPMESGR